MALCLHLEATEREAWLLRSQMLERILLSAQLGEQLPDSGPVSAGPACHHFDDQSFKHLGTHTLLHGGLVEGKDHKTTESSR